MSVMVWLEWPKSKDDSRNGYVRGKISILFLMNYNFLRFLYIQSHFPTLFQSYKSFGPNFFSITFTTHSSIFFYQYPSFYKLNVSKNGTYNIKGHKIDSFTIPFNLFTYLFNFSHIYPCSLVISPHIICS